MLLIVKNIKWILLVVGIVTCSMMLLVVSPVDGLVNTFGASYPGVDHPLAQIVTRSWGMLVTLTGVMLIYAAFNVQVRNFAMVVASISKVFFIGLVLIYAGQYMDRAIIAVVFDSLAVTIFAFYLLSKKIGR